MQKAFPAILLIGILVLGSVAPTSFAFAQSDKVKVLIGFDGKPDVSLVNQHGGNVKDNFHPFINVVSAELPSAAIQGLENNPKISYIEPDLIATIHDHPYVGDYAKVWGVTHIEADMVHPTPSGNGVNVVVIDTGIDYSHDALGNYVGGWDYVNNDNDPMDDHGHGTHVSGTISGDITNSEIIGVAYDVNLYGVKVLSASGSGSYTNVINGIKWAADNGMDVANLSLGGGSSTSLCEAVTEATNSGVLVIASAGNSGNPKGKGTNTGYPATCLDAIAVAATTKTDSRASFSSTGPAVEISAPGSGVYSSVLGGNYATWSGTSMAAPHVSGVAALIKDANPTLTPQIIRTILQDTAIDLGETGRDKLYGFGLLDAPDAVTEAISYTGSNPISPTPDFTITASPNSFSVNVGETASSTITLNALDGFADSINLSTDNGSLSPTSVSISESQSGTSQLSLDTSTAGTFTVTITGTNGTLPHSTTINLTVNPQPTSPSGNFDSEIVFDVENKRKFNNLLITVIATDNENNSSLLSNIPVQLTLSRGTTSWDYTGTTDESGSISFKLMKARSNEVYTATITNWSSVFSTGQTNDCGHINSSNNWVSCSP
jgi:subtilisin